MQPIFGRIDEIVPTPPSFIALAFPDGLEDRKVDGRVNTADDVVEI